MDNRQKDHQIKTGAILAIALFCCLCSVLALVGGVAAWSTFRKHTGSQLIGFDYSNKVPGQISGDTAAANHIFIHNYPFPSDGWLTGITYLNDAEDRILEQQEEIFILVLRPEKGIYRILYRQEIMLDDLVPIMSGETEVIFSQPLMVREGDLLAHWQPTGQAGGPIPLNLDQQAFSGYTSGKAGFQFEDTSPGELIFPEGFSGCRDYFLRAIFQPGE